MVIELYPIPPDSALPSTEWILIIFLLGVIIGLKIPQKKKRNALIYYPRTHPSLVQPLSQHQGVEAKMGFPETAENNDEPSF